MASPAEITIQQLNRLIGTPAAPMIIDARIEADFDEDPRVIPGAIRHPHDSVKQYWIKLIAVRLSYIARKGIKSVKAWRHCYGRMG